MAVSHRSAEVKPTLRQMPVWRSSRWAIDATYVPAWETNTGMIWGLFGSTPAIGRVQTPTYRESLWCRREAEMIEYLAEGSDFMSDRHVMDVDLDGVEVFAELDDHWGGKASSDTLSVLPDFPPNIQVWTPPPLAESELAMLRAAGALRAMSAFLRDPELVNRLVTQVLLTVKDLPGPAPTTTRMAGVRTSGYSPSFANSYPTPTNSPSCYLRTMPPTKSPGTISCSSWYRTWRLVCPRWTTCSWPSSSYGPAGRA